MSPDAPPSPPRRFRLRALDATTKFLLMFGAIWFAVGTMITTAFTTAGGPFWNDLILDRRGVTVEATPTAIEPTSSSINHQQVFRIVYTFRDRNGAPHTSGSGTTDGGMLARANGGLPMSIDYDPNAPSLSRLSGGRASFFGWFVLFPAAFAVVGAVILAVAWRRLSRLRDIYVNGHAIQAVVTAVSATHMRMNNRRLARVDYAFDVITGRATGHTTALTPPAVGDRLWVLYRPSNPAENVAA